MKPRIIALSVATLVAGFAVAPSWALGLGQMQVLSTQGQPLHAEVDVKAAGPKEAEILAVYPAAHLEYQRQGLVYVPGLSSLSVKLESRGSKTVAVLRTVQPMSEPYLVVVLEGEGIGGRVRRTYASLLSPDAPEQMPEMTYVLPARVGPAALSVTAATQEPLRIDASTRRALAGASASTQYTNIFEKGRAGKTHALRGAVDNLSFRRSLWKILPRGWKLIAPPGALDGGYPSSWSGDGRSWVEVLDALFVEHNVFATIDWARRRIVLHNSPARLNVDRVSAQIPSDAQATPWRGRTLAARKEELDQGLGRDGTPSPIAPTPTPTPTPTPAQMPGDGLVARVDQNSADGAHDMAERERRMPPVREAALQRVRQLYGAADPRPADAK